MQISRRNLLRSTGALGGAAAIAGVSAGPSGLANAAVAGTSRIARAGRADVVATTTLDGVLLRDTPVVRLARRRRRHR